MRQSRVILPHNIKIIRKCKLFKSEEILNSTKDLNYAMDLIPRLNYSLDGRRRVSFHVSSIIGSRMMNGSIELWIHSSMKLEIPFSQLDIEYRRRNKQQKYSKINNFCGLFETSKKLSFWLLFFCCTLHFNSLRFTFTHLPSFCVVDLEGWLKRLFRRRSKSIWSWTPEHRRSMSTHSRMCYRASSRDSFWQSKVFSFLSL